MAEKKELTPLFEPFDAYDTGFLEVGDGHVVYYEQSGNPNGKPAIFVHGGPGGATSPEDRRFFDPKIYRVVLFDERGCGKSTPHAKLENNTTWDLVADMEKIREKLGIEKWLVFGGSWGSTLSLSYAVTHPDKVTEIVLRGIFLIRRKELAWFYQGNGANYIYPDAWEQYIDFIPWEEREDVMAAYHKRLTGNGKAAQLEAARRWSLWEAATSCLYPSAKKMSSFDDDERALAFARIENHYFLNKGFFPRDGWLLEKEQIDRIRDIPSVIVQGRYDCVCPAISAWDLHRAWPQAEFHIIQNSGHASTEPGTRSKLVEYTNKYGKDSGKA